MSGVIALVYCFAYVAVAIWIGAEIYAFWLLGSLTRQQLNRRLANARARRVNWREWRRREDTLRGRLEAGQRETNEGEARMSRSIGYLALGGGTRSVETTMNLGRGVMRHEGYGLRRALWDAAFGYVSGFRKRDIAYYVATRSLSQRINYRVLAWEDKRGLIDHTVQMLDYLPELEGADQIVPVGTLEIVCPSCGEEIPVPVLAGLFADDDQQSVRTEPDLTQLWAHMWTHPIEDTEAGS